MKSGINPKSLALLFPVVLVLYLLVFFGIEHIRHRKGPWTVRFQADPGQAPRIEISQPHLGLRNAAIIFPGEQTSATKALVIFDQVDRSIPFGKIIYRDLTFLPGVVTFDLFGHEIELLPRTLIVNKKEIAWQSGMVVELSPAMKPAEPPRPPRQR